MKVGAVPPRGDIDGSVQQKIYRPIARKRCGARVKRWGKSLPRKRQRFRQCKPIPVQGQIRNRTARSMIPGWSHPSQDGTWRFGVR